MVTTSTPKKPLLLLKLLLDQGTQKLAGKTINFKSESYNAGVLDWAVIDRSIPVPPGQVQISDAQVEVVDLDNSIKQLFNTTTPLRRLAQIIFEDENQPLGPLADPIYTGEIDDGIDMPTGRVTIPLRDITAAWLGRKIPQLGIRDNFPNLPDFIDSFFVPIIFGLCQSFTESGVEPQGVIKCWECDTTLHRFVVARHSCYAVPTVYRKLPKLSSIFHVVSPAEYQIVLENKTINNITYPMTYIQFHAAQPYGTEIHADVAGLDYRVNLSNGQFQSYGQADRNPVYCQVALILVLLEDEINIQRFSAQDFIDTAQRCDDKSYFCDGAITDHITAGEAISRINSDFDIDFYPTNHGLIKVHLYDAELDANDVALINTNFIERMTFTPSVNKEIFNRFRFRYFHQNALLTEFIKSSNTGQWGREDTYDYIPDQQELGAKGQNPILEKEIELHFIRDSNVAKNVIKRRIGYFTLRSYTATFNLPLPEFLTLDLAQLLSVTHFAGVSSTGWTNQIMKTFRITHDLKTWRATIGAIFIAHISDADLSYNGIAPAHDPQIIYPQLSVMVGDLATYLDYPDADPQAILSSTYPGAPATPSDTEGDVPDTFNFTTSAGTIKQLPKSKVSFVNVRFQEDSSISPRHISAYVPVPLGDGVQIITGTLSPDQRPTGLQTTDIYKVLFYATDFDHFYWYVGTGELGSPSGWLVVDQTDDEIKFRRTAPANPVAWHLCDGSANVMKSDYKGDTSIITVPNLIGAYAKGASVYSGPLQTPGVGPSVTDPGHEHIVAVNGVTFPNQGQHGHNPATSVTDLGHTHQLSDTETDSADISHDHGWASGGGNGEGAIIISASATVAAGGEAGFRDVAMVGDQVIDGGRTLDQLYDFGPSGPNDSTHTHRLTGQHTDDAHSNISVGLTFSGFDGSHQHGVASAGVATIHSTGISIQGNGEPVHVGLLPFIRL